MSPTYKPKLIEVALPLDTINKEAAREKSIRHGHPSTLHLWWARRPLAAARAVIWASLVDDPSGDHSLTAEQQDAERQRLFRILEELVVWENSNNLEVLARAQAEIERCFPEGAPPILDPFGGGGAIPLEAQRLGLTALSGDLNPVAVLIQKAMIEIPPRFAGRPPVHPDIDTRLTTWQRAQGLAADVAKYGEWMREEAFKRIGHMYPEVEGPDGQKLTPIAWIWARTVESPDPSWNAHVPLVASWTLANKAGKPKTWIEPIIDRENQSITYAIREGGEPTFERTVGRGGGYCLATGASMPFTYIRKQFQAGAAGQHLLAVVAEGRTSRCYISGSDAQTSAATVIVPERSVAGSIFDWPGRTNVVRYGMTRWVDLFSPRQLVALTTFSDLLKDVRGRVVADALAADLEPDATRLRDGGAGAEAYADAVTTYLAFAVDKCANLWASLVSWMSDRGALREVFARQAIPMVWDFAEANPFSGVGGSWDLCLDKVQKAVGYLPARGITAEARQRDARARIAECPGASISTDPPYYDNISYADLSDFFFVWLRRNLADVWPDECATLATPKSDELIANQYRAGSKARAEKHFENGMAEVMRAISSHQPADVPATIYYAYKATETKDGSVRSTGWDTFLQAVLDAGLQVTATWPVRTESAGRMVAKGTNALASSIVLACRPRRIDAAMATRAEFIAALRTELPEAVHLLQSGNIAPVDMAQSTIGPGIKVFSRYAKVVESDGSTMRVSTALGLINDVLSEVLDGEQSELDADTRFAVTWYAQHGFGAGPAGDADGQARAKNTTLDGLTRSGIGEAHGGTFRLYKRAELPANWDPIADERSTVWEATQHLALALERSESEAATLLGRLGGVADRARQLAYLLFHKATEKGWAEEAGVYNGLITTWPQLQALASHAPPAAAPDAQGRLL